MTVTVQELRDRGVDLSALQEWPAVQSTTQDAQVGEYMIYGANRVAKSRRRGVPAIAMRRSVWAQLVTIRRGVHPIAAVWPCRVFVSVHLPVAGRGD